MLKSPTYGFLAGAISVHGQKGLTLIMTQELTRIVARFGSRHLCKSNSNNDPSLGHSNLVSNEAYICLGLLFTISW